MRFLDYFVTRTGRRRMLWELKGIFGGKVTFLYDGDLKVSSPRLNRSARKAFLQGYNDPEIFEWLDERLKPGMVFLDVGANVGLYALFAAKRVGPTGKVYAFEADPATARWLEANRAANGMENLRVVSSAVGSVPGMLTFVVDKKNLGASQVADGSDAGLSVPVITLDQFCASEGVGRVDVAKMDLEGYEIRALRGASATLDSNPELVMITEVNRKHLARYGHTPDELRALLEPMGFRAYLLSGTRLEPYDFAWNSADVLWLRDARAASDETQESEDLD